MEKKPLIIIAGPTSSDKTSLSVELAKEINGEITSVIPSINRAGI